MADNQALQRDEDVVVFSAFGGVRNDVTPERYSNTDLQVGDNVDIDKSGRVFRRQGYTPKLAGAAHSLWADRAQQQCLFVSGGQLRQMNPDMTATPLAALRDTISRVSFERVNERTYFSNGTDIGIVENGSVRSWGMPQPPLPGATPTVGNMPVGTYQFAMTWLRVDGQESGTGMAGVVQVTDGGVAFTLPVAADPAIVAKILYLTPCNGDQLMQAAVIPNAQTSFTYSNDTTELNQGLETQFRQAPPPGQLIAWYRGRLFVAVGSMLCWSDPFGYELFDLRKYVDLDGRITLLAPMIDKELSDAGRASGFFIGTDKSCGLLVGSDPDSFQYVPKLGYGAILGALDYVDGALFRDGATGARPLPVWLTTEGICVGMPDLQVHNLTRSRYSFDAAGQGAALFMDGPNRFIATANL
jgi:hypothetical protein